MNNGQKLLKKPVYKEGKEAMSKFIKENLKYPEKAKENKIEGVVSVRLDIDGAGKVKKAEVKKKLGHGCDEEAVRVASLLEFFVDSKRKMKMTFHKTINVHFRLPKEKKKVVKKPAAPQRTLGATTATSRGNLTIVYSYVSTPKKK